MIKKRIPVEDLQLGMYVVELDRPWVGTSFAFQGFRVTTADEIESLRSYCANVYVDPEREHAAAAERHATRLRGDAVYEQQKTLEAEMPAAQAIYEQCQDALRDLTQRLATVGAVDASMLRTAVAGMAESIRRNPDAMLLLNRLQAKETHELARAMDTSILMITFGRFLCYSNDRLEALGLAGMLLDIGKTGGEYVPAVPRPMYVREPDERVKAHVMSSVELINAASGLPGTIADIVSQHHERQDGEGYPRGLRAEKISIDGAIAALVDAYAELTCERPDAAPATPSNALALLHKMRGTLFHEALVEQFIQCIGIYPVGSAVELSSGEIGLVIAQNLVRRLQPRVMVVLNRDRSMLRPHKILDLIREPKTLDGESYRIRRTLPRDALPLDVREFFV